MAISLLLGIALVFASYWVAGQGLDDVQDDAARAQEEPYRLAMVCGYVLRLIASTMVTVVPIFSHGLGNRGDAIVYEMGAERVAHLWYIDGIRWIDIETLEIGAASNALLAIHIYGVLTFLNNGVVPVVACVAVNAFFAVATCHLICLLGTMIGGSVQDSRLVSAVMFFSPAFVYHTSELYKDGVVALLVVAAVYLSFRLAARFDARDMLLAVLCIYGLWWVRFYLVFLVSAPFVMSLVGLRAVDSARVGISVLAIAIAGAIFMSTDFGTDAIELGVDTYERATQEGVLAFNADGGSGVLFEGPSYVTFPLKIFYTLFSPFPWDFRTWSIAFQVGKLDALIWYYFAFNGLRGARQMWRDDRGTLLMFLVVLLPMTFAYASSFSNIGLIVRQRIPVTLLGSILAVRAWSDKRASVGAFAGSESGPAPRHRDGRPIIPSPLSDRPAPRLPSSLAGGRAIRRPVLRPRTH